jgi:truncated hemoglobin YjbI
MGAALFRIHIAVPKMTDIPYPKFPTQQGYMTGKTQHAYIAAAIEKGLLPADARHNAAIVSLTAPSDPDTPIQFWQLFSVLGVDAIVVIVQDFYERVFADDDWFVAPFARIGGVEHHTVTQASMWADTMGGGPYYHGAEFRLSFHHTHNAMAVMNDRGAARWVVLMNETLEACADHMTDDPRVRIAINTFLTHFLGKYVVEFSLGDLGAFGEVNGVFA